MDHSQSATRHMHCHGQAMIELAVFGSLLLMCLAFLVRYGLLYNYQQMTQQEAMRQALMMANDPAAMPFKQGSVTLVRDRRMIDPSNPFVTGPRQTFVSGASVSLGNAAGVMQPTKDSELPLQRVILNDGNQPLTFRAADFRIEADQFGTGVPKARICAYVDVFGRAGVEIIDPNNPSGPPLYYQCKSRFDPPTIKPDPGFSFYFLRIMDGCVGDFMAPVSCRQQCQAIQEALLHIPSYCSNLPADDVPMGLDLKHLDHSRTVNRNERIRSENWGAHQSESHVDESDTYHRKINLSPIRERQSNFDPNNDGTVNTTQTINTKRDETFSTPWQ